MSKAVRSDVEDLELQIQHIEKEYRLLINKVSRSPYNMTMETFMGLTDANRMFLIKEEIDFYCERDNQIRELRKQQAEIRLQNKEYFREGVWPKQ
jgi:phosphatidate phosphatase APP1